MKTYDITRFTDGQDVALQVNVPTHKELQHVSEFGNLRVVISNFSYGKKQHYCVAKFHKEEDKILIKLGFIFKTVAEDYDVETYIGSSARKNAIECAGDMLIDRR